MDTETAFVIRYTYPGSTNGRPVGAVYVTGPHFSRDIYSYSYRVADAARWDSRVAAEQAAERWRRSAATAVSVREAVDLVEGVLPMTDTELPDAPQLRPTTARRRP